MPSPNARLEKQFYQADKLIESGQIAEATDILLAIIEEDPGYGRAYNHLGYIYELQFRDFAQAEKYYQKAIETAPDYPASYLNYCILLGTQQRFDELKPMLEKALSIPGINKAKVNNEYGIMYEIQGDYDLAIEAYKNAVRFSFIDADIASYRDSIRRCKEKKALLN